MKNYVGAPYHERIYVFTDEDKKLYTKLKQDETQNLDKLLLNFAKEYIISTRQKRNPDIFKVQILHDPFCKSKPFSMLICYE